MEDIKITDNIEEKVRDTAIVVCDRLSIVLDDARFNLLAKYILDQLAVDVSVEEIARYALLLYNERLRELLTSHGIKF